MHLWTYYTYVCVHCSMFDCLCMYLSLCVRAHTYMPTHMCKYVDGRAQPRLSRSDWAELSHRTGLFLICSQSVLILLSYLNLQHKDWIRWSLRMHTWVRLHHLMWRASRVFLGSCLISQFCLYTMYITLVSVFQRNRTN